MHLEKNAQSDELRKETTVDAPLPSGCPTHTMSLPAGQTHLTVSYQEPTIDENEVPLKDLPYTTIYVSAPKRLKPFASGQTTHVVERSSPFAILLVLLGTGALCHSNELGEEGIVPLTADPANTVGCGDGRLAIPCARATRSRRLPSLDARTLGNQQAPL